MTLDEFVSRLENAKRSGAGWIAKCPAHDDNRASLGVSQGDNGKILVKCYANCEFSAILASMQLEAKDLMGDPMTSMHTQPQEPIVYDYRDEDGKLLYQAIRKPDKKFLQRKPAAGGGWDWKVGDVRRVPYRLKELLASTGTVYIVEGEKDANRLWSLGLPATTNVGGAGKWTEALSPHLKGRDVVILPDNDEPGEKHAASVMQSLTNVAASVRIVRLPGLKEKGDVSDYLDSGKTKDDLLAFIAKSQSSGPRIYTLQDAADSYLVSLASGKEKLFSLGLKPVDEALGGGVASGEMIILAARPSHGKSAMALQVLDHASTQGHTCMMISEEMGRIALGKRTIAYAVETYQEDWIAEMETVKREVGAHFKRREKCIVAEGCGSVDVAIEQIRKAVDVHGVKYVAVDYVQILGAKGPDMRSRVSYASQKLREVANETEVVLIVLAQLKRDVELRKTFLPLASDLKESGQLEQDADVILSMCWPHRFDMKLPSNEYLVFAIKNRNREIKQGMVTCDFIPRRQKFKAQRPENYNHDLADFNDDTEVGPIDF